MRNFRDIPIRQKLMLITMLTTTAALVISGIGVVISDSILLRSYLQGDLSALAHIIAANSTAALASKILGQQGRCYPRCEPDRISCPPVFIGPTGPSSPPIFVHAKLPAKHRSVRPSICSMNYVSPAGS